MFIFWKIYGKKSFVHVPFNTDILTQTELTKTKNRNCECLVQQETKKELKSFNTLKNETNENLLLAICPYKVLILIFCFYFFFQTHVHILTTTCHKKKINKMQKKIKDPEVQTFIENNSISYAQIPLQQQSIKITKQKKLVKILPKTIQGNNISLWDFNTVVARECMRVKGNLKNIKWQTVAEDLDCYTDSNTIEKLQYLAFHTLFNISAIVPDLKSQHSIQCVPPVPPIAPLKQQSEIKIIVVNETKENIIEPTNNASIIENEASKLLMQDDIEMKDYDKREQLQSQEPKNLFHGM